MQKKPLIGVIAPVLARVFMQDILRGAIAQLRLCGCDTIVLAPLIQFNHTLPAHAAAEREIFRMIAAPEFDAFLYLKDEATMGAEVIAEIEQRLLRSQKYVMTVDDRAHPVFDSTQYDDYDDFGKVVEHMIEVHGYKRIYCLTGPADSQQAQSRLRAWKDRMTQHGLYFDENYWHHGTFWYDTVPAYAERLFSGELPMPEAIVCGNDVMAVSLIKTLLMGGVRVPEDVAVTGYDGYPFTSNVDVTLTTYMRNHYQLGADAVRRLYRNLTGLLCSKVERQRSGFLIGSSCGCSNIPTNQLLPDPDTAIPRMWEEYMFGVGMAPALAQADSVDSLLLQALGCSKDIYEMQRVCIYLSDAQGYRLAASCTADGAPQTHHEITLQNSVSAFLTGDSAPETVFLSPLHMNARQFGLISLSYGDSSRVYDKEWLHFVTELELAFDHLPDDAPEEKSDRSRSAMHETLVQLREKMRAAPGEPWTVEQLCAESGLPKSTLQKHYKQQFGKSLFEDLILFRVDAAKRMLTETQLSLGEIAAACGYSTESYFMKQFKRITGQTPTEYRRGH